MSKSSWPQREKPGASFMGSSGKVVTRAVVWVVPSFLSSQQSLSSMGRRLQVVNALCCSSVQSPHVSLSLFCLGVWLLEDSQDHLFKPRSPVGSSSSQITCAGSTLGYNHSQKPWL